MILRFVLIGEMHDAVRVSTKPVVKPNEGQGKPIVVGSGLIDSAAVHDL